MPQIALDLELERPNTEKQASDSSLDKERIIQVGYTVFDINPFTIIKSECLHVNIGVSLSKYIKALTGITDNDIENGTTLDEIYLSLKKDREQFNAERILVVWGSGDDKALKSELGHPNDWPFGRAAFNVKHLFRAYCKANNISASGGLKKSRGKVGLKWTQERAHNALNDALATAEFYSWLIAQYKK